MEAGQGDGHAYDHLRDLHHRDVHGAVCGGEGVGGSRLSEVSCMDEEVEVSCMNE